MAFLLDNLGKVSSGANTNAPTMWSYTSTDNQATSVAADYFIAKGGQGGFSVGDGIYLVATDGINNYSVTTSTTAGVTITIIA